MGCSIGVCRFLHCTLCTTSTLLLQLKLHTCASCTPSDAGAPPCWLQVRTIREGTILHGAALSERPDAVEWVLQQLGPAARVAMLNTPDQEGLTPLQRAATEGQLEALVDLANAGGDLNQLSTGFVCSLDMQKKVGARAGATPHAAMRTCHILQIPCNGLQCLHFTQPSASMPD